tara:strand:+ start:1637 stop:2554 length:918 start_codon:yes stop_codon:yes gene_type:complete
MAKKLKYKGLLKPKKKSISQSNEYSPGNKKEDGDTLSHGEYRRTQEVSKKKAARKKWHDSRPKKEKEVPKDHELEKEKERLDILEKGEAMFEGPELPTWHEVAYTADSPEGAKTDPSLTKEVDVNVAEAEKASSEKSKAKMAAKYGGKMCAGCGGKMHEGGNIMKHDHPHADLPYTQEEFDKLDPGHKEKLSAGFPGMYKIGADTPTKQQLDAYRIKAQGDKAKISSKPSQQEFDAMTPEEKSYYQSRFGGYRISSDTPTKEQLKKGLGARTGKKSFSQTPAPGVKKLSGGGHANYGLAKLKKRK